MPPTGEALLEEQISLVRQWIEQGANPVPNTDGEGGVQTDSGLTQATLEVGEIVDRVYSPLSDGDVLRIRFGTQGGVWIMPTLRAAGLETSVTIETRLSSLDGRVMGEISFAAEMTPTLQGAELQNIAIPIFDDSNVEQLYGTEATLFVSVMDDEGAEASAEQVVVLQPA